MAAKTQSESTTRGSAAGSGRRGRRREISGILLLAGGLFAGLALASQQVDSAPAMGPGGAAIASALYSVWGMAAYLLVAAMLVASVRCFRGRALVDGVREGLGALMLMRLGFGAAVPAVRGQRHPAARPGRAARRMVGRARGRVHRQRRRRADRDHRDGDRAVDGDRDQHARGRGGARVGGPPRRARHRRRCARCMARDARRVPREGRQRRRPACARSP